MQAAALPVILSLAGTAATMIGGLRQRSALGDAEEAQMAAAEQAERIGAQNAALQEAETAETVRREKLAAEESQSMRKARAAAGGGTLTGSTQGFLEEQERRDEDYIGWLEKSGASRAAIERERGTLAGMEGRAAAKETGGRKDAALWETVGAGVRGASKVWNLYNPAGP